MKENNFRYVEVKKKLIEVIQSLEPHDRLPSRTALAEQYNAARTTIERAISELVGEGYLYSRDGSGTYVAEREDQSAKKSLKTIGLIIPDIMHDTYPGILRGVEDVTNQHDINLVVCNTDNQVEKQSKYISKLIDAGVNGVIIVPALIGESDLEPVQRLQALKIPVVFCNRGMEGIEAPKVVSNNFYGAYIAVKHLIQNGCKKVAYISLPMYSISYERYQGYISAMSEAKLDIDERYICFEQTFDSETQGYECGKRLLQDAEPPDGIFCFNDGIAKGVYDAMTELGYVVGKDIKLIGYDDTSLCERLPVKLSSVKFKTYEIGMNAAKLVIEMMMNGKEMRKRKIIVLQPELVIRESSVTTAK